MPVDSGPTQGTNPMGAGPFKPVSYEVGTVVKMAWHEEYWEGPAFPDAVEARDHRTHHPPDRVAHRRVAHDQHIPLDRVGELQGDATLQVKTWFPLNFDFINMNHTFEPFQNPKVRVAFDMIIDKEALMQGALWGQGATTASPSFPTSAAYNKDLNSAPRISRGPRRCWPRRATPRVA